MKLSEAIEEINKRGVMHALEILAKVEEPVWTDAKPMREGWYWYDFNLDGPAGIVQVAHAGPTVGVVKTERWLAVLIPGQKELHGLSEFHGRWSSEPISMPRGEK